MNKKSLCIWDVTNKPWIRVDLRDAEDVHQAVEEEGLSFLLRTSLYLPECCAECILARVLDEIADFNLRHKHFTDLFVIDFAVADKVARNVARAFLGNYHSVLMREAELARRERSFETEGFISKNAQSGTEKIHVVFHWDKEWGIEAVGAYKDRKIAELECQMLALDCKYTYQRIYHSEFSLHGELYGSDFFEKGGSGWNILDSEGNPEHTFRVEEVTVGRSLDRKNYSWEQILGFIEPED